MCQEELCEPPGTPLVGREAAIQQRRVEGDDGSAVHKLLRLANPWPCKVKKNKVWKVNDGSANALEANEDEVEADEDAGVQSCLLYTSPSPRD